MLFAVSGVAELVSRLRESMPVCPILYFTSFTAVEDFAPVRAWRSTAPLRPLTSCAWSRCLGSAKTYVIKVTVAKWSAYVFSRAGAFFLVAGHFELYGPTFCN